MSSLEKRNVSLQHHVVVVPLDEANISYNSVRNNSIKSEQNEVFSDYTSSITSYLKCFICSKWLDSNTSDSWTEIQNCMSSLSETKMTDIVHGLIKSKMKLDFKVNNLIFFCFFLS